MQPWQYREGMLCCEAVPLATIAQEVGTPCYVYSLTAMRDQYRLLENSLQDVPHLICFALKACANLAILKIFIREGSGVDIVSGGELYRALAAGADPQKIVYAGVGKSEEEIAYALKSNILMFNVESPQELSLINRVAATLGVQARVALRINPEVDPKTHPYIATGLKQSKFGISLAEARELVRVGRGLSHIELAGVHCHIGSQITKLAPFVEAADKVAQFVRELQQAGIGIRYVNLGGGVGIAYNEESPPTLSEYAEAIRPIVTPLGCTLIVELGRSLVGNGGALITRVLYTKKTPVKNFLVVDAGMNDLIRPSLYRAYHAILPVDEAHQKEEPVVVDVVGPVCETGDFLAQDRPLPLLEPGELLAVMSAGAYGFCMASNYNARPRPPEVLVQGDRYWVIRERETYADLVRGETIPPCLQGG
ncbi:MAG: diaminopimelate decarboxylase [Nitrospinota bacterium]|nr:MAG: diaminopimelate decarboxylase [Nitrospinota bacterium]